MKIALVCPFNMLDRPGGIPQVVIHLAEGLKQKGHYVKVITQRPSSFKGEPPEDYILLGKTRTFSGGMGTEGNWAWPSDGEEIANVLNAEQFDVINFHEPWMPTLAWQMLKRSKAAHVGTFHANLMDTSAGKAWTIFKPYGVPLIRSLDIITATSPASSGMLLSRANMKSPKDRELIKTLTYIPCGVDLKTYKPFKKRSPISGPGTKTIVYVGRLEKRKGVDWLLMAFAELQKRIPEAHLVIAGSGLRADKLRDFVRSEKIKNVSFPGYVSDEQKRYLLGNADLACFPATFGEGFGIVLLETMAMGTPLLAGNNIGYMNVMKGPGKIGLVDPQSTIDFANRMEIFLTDDQQRRIMRTWELADVKQYDYQKIVDQYLAVYKRAISMKKTSNSQEKDQNEPKRKAFHRFFVRRHTR